jgi:NO-binding membrane sensor protein with MHYT domain
MHALLFPLFGAFLVIRLAICVVVVWAFVDAYTRPQHAFAAAAKQTKQIWLAITGVAMVFGVLGFGFLGLIALVAAIVYLVDVRPRVREIPKGGGPTHMGPYGPW